jgi:hypothetical protein
MATPMTGHGPGCPVKAHALVKWATALRLGASDTDRRCHMPGEPR